MPISESRSGGPLERRPQLLQILMMAVWFGLVTGLVEAVGFLGLQAAGLLTWNVKVTAIDQNILWISPIVDLMIALALAAVVFLVTRVVRFKQWPVVATGVFAVFFWYDFIALTGRLRERGTLMLALGLATVVARGVSRAPERWLAFFRRTLAPIALVALLAAGGVKIGQRMWESRQMSRLPPPVPAPNVLFLILDTLRADRLGCYGYARPTTPFLDEYARRAVLFENAISSASWTLPSHASMFTGYEPFEHGATLEPYDGRFPTLAQIFGSRGAVSAGFAANSEILTRPFGLPRGFIVWKAPFETTWDATRRTLYGRRMQKAFESRYLYAYAPRKFMSAEEVNHLFLRWLDGRPARPFLAFLNYMDTHLPGAPPREFARRFSEQPRHVNFERLVAEDPFNPEDLKEISNQYDASLAYLDSELRNLFDELRRRNLDQNLLVVITSDHGESIGEHELIGHRTSLYLDQLHVPLLIRFPGKTPEGLRVAVPVGTRSLAATIAEMAGLGDSGIPGPSLSPCWSGGPCGESEILSEVDKGGYPGADKHWPVRQGWVKSLLTEKWHFILQQTGKRELFDWKSDPLERRDLAGTPEGQAVVQELMNQLAKKAPLRGLPAPDHSAR